MQLTKIRKFFLLVLGLIILPANSWAVAPRKLGFAGAGRSGILQEALETNPAALAYLDKSLGFGYIGMPRIKDWQAGGRQLHVGVYDGENQYLRAGFSFEKDSRAILLANGARGYRDRTTFKFGGGAHATSFMDLGATVKYVRWRDGGPEQKYMDGDIGALLKVFKGTQLGLTYENLGYRADELPPTLGAGIRYDILGPTAVLVDGAYALKGDLKDKKQWSYGMELGLSDELIGRGGIFQDSINGLRGYAAGFSWQGPRTSFDYGLRISRHAPVQREHVLGMTVQL